MNIMASARDLSWYPRPSLLRRRCAFICMTATAVFFFALSASCCNAAFTSQPYLLAWLSELSPQRISLQ